MTPVTREFERSHADRVNEGPGGGVSEGTPLGPAQVEACVQRALQTAPVHDIHTHLYAPQFGDVLLWGIDDLLTYHYLVAEFFRVAGQEITIERFWALPKPRQSDLVWKHLFVERSPISEAARGVVTCLNKLGLEAGDRDLAGYRRYFANRSLASHLDEVLALSGVRTIVMTNDPFEEREQAVWRNGGVIDDRFRPALRLDGLLNDWPTAGRLLRDQGYAVEPDLSGSTAEMVRRFLDAWIARMRPLYLAASLSPDFRYPDESGLTRLLRDCVLPVARAHDLPVALMIGCRRQINPHLRLAGDGVGHADLATSSNLCLAYPDVRFLCTVLARENQHELAVIARKFRNLHLFGCWWFANTPSLAEEITRMRVELLGHSFTPQHSDVRVLDQLIYKWSDTRAMLARVLTDKYAALLAAGWPLTDSRVVCEVEDFLGAGGMKFITGGPPTA